MNSNIKPLITLSNINSLPDGHVHSKISFLKSIINEDQNPEMRQMKERMLKLTYTVKNIGIHGEEIGISSKRVPLKEKEDFVPSEITNEKRKEIFIKKYLPQNSFFSQPLVAIKKQKTEQLEKIHSEKQSFLLDASRINQNEYSETHHISSESKFSKKAFNKTKFGSNFLTSSKYKTFKTDRNIQKEENFEKMKRSYSQQQLPEKRFENKKSFAKLLNECGNVKKEEFLMPIQHEENPLFKKIKKLKEISGLKTLGKYENYRSNRAITQIPSQSTTRYQEMVEKGFHRRTLSKNM